MHRNHVRTNTRTQVTEITALSVRLLYILTGNLKLRTAWFSLHIGRRKIQALIFLHRLHLTNCFVCMPKAKILKSPVESFPFTYYPTTDRSKHWRVKAKKWLVVRHRPTETQISSFEFGLVNVTWIQLLPTASCCWVNVWRGKLVVLNVHRTELPLPVSRNMNRDAVAENKMRSRGSSQG